MYRYGQFCPIAIACEILTERWTPLILRELMVGKFRFNDLMRGLPLISRTLLAQRLRELETAGLVERTPKSSGRGYEYRLTPAGQGAQPIIMQLGEWGREWVYPEVMKRDLDPLLLMWDIHQRLHTDALPPKRTVVEFYLRGLPRSLPPSQKGMKRWWLVLEKPDVELCLTDPGYEVDLLVEADLFAMTRVWMGEQKIQDAQRELKVILRGPPRLVKAFPGWLKLSVFAQLPEQSMARTAD
jgi:DNA-binding HxlR family transcriptional regulator